MADIEQVTGLLREAFQPHVGQRQYGNLRIAASFPACEDSRLAWWAMYESVFGSTLTILSSFSEGVYCARRSFNSEKIKTPDPNELVTIVKANLQSIPLARLEHLRKDAQAKKDAGMVLDEALAALVKHAQDKPLFGPTDEELRLYAQYCEQVWKEA